MINWHQLLPAWKQSIRYLEIGKTNHLYLQTAFSIYGKNENSKFYRIPFPFPFSVSEIPENIFIRDGQPDAEISKLENNFFDVIYISGANVTDTAQLLETIVLSFRKLNMNGFLIFDDIDCVQETIYTFLKNYEKKMITAKIDTKIIAHKINYMYTLNTDYLTVYQYDEKIRLGKKEDGGYVIASLKDGYDCYITCGIEYSDSFSNDFLDKYDVNPCYGFDGTIDKLPSDFPKNVTFIKKNIGPVENDKQTNLKTIIHNFNNIFLKMDIECGEYEWLLCLTKEELLRFKQIVMEVHFINSDHDTHSNVKYQFFKKLTETHYIVHLHGNTTCGVHNNIPDVIEITLIRKDQIPVPKLNTLPLPDDTVDFPNSKNTQNFNLNFKPFVNL